MEVDIGSLDPSDWFASSTINRSAKMIATTQTNAPVFWTSIKIVREWWENSEFD